MALINCPECGGSVSDKATMCPHCGCPISAQESITDSGPSGNSSEQTTENTGATAAQKTSNKRTILMAVIAVCIVIVIILIVIFSTREKNPYAKDGLYNGIAWGTSYDNVANQISKNGNDVNLNEKNLVVIETMDDYDGFKGVVGDVIYGCDDGTLQSVYITITTDDSNYTAREVYEKLVDELSQVYGEGKMTYSYEVDWTTSESEISILIFSEDLLGISFKKS